MRTQVLPPIGQLLTMRKLSCFKYNRIQMFSNIILLISRSETLKKREHEFRSMI